jgi:hypothetical protein
MILSDIVGYELVDIKRPVQALFTKHKQYEKLIDKAAKVSGEGSNFIRGCRDFLASTGYLTPRQIECLKKPFPSRNDDEFMSFYNPNE